MTRYGVMVWDAEGDMGDAVVLGPFRTVEKADERAAQVWRRAAREEAESVQAMVVPIANASLSDALDWVL